MSNRKKIVITGASGFLGRHLVERLKNDKRYTVFAMSSKPEQLRECFGGDNVDYIHKDMLNADMLKDSIVINCAYPRHATGTAVADGLKYIQRVFESAVECNASAIINISSQSVYSQQRTKVATEETEVCMESPYAVGKYAIELLLESVCKGKSTKYTNLRLASLIGPGFDQRIVNRLIVSALKKGYVNINVSERKLGFLDICDATCAIIALLDVNHQFWKQVYNLGNGIAYSVKEIAECISEVLLEEKGNKIGIQEMQSDENGTTAVSGRLLEIDTKYRPRVTLKESVYRILKEFI